MRLITDLFNLRGVARADDTVTGTDLIAFVCGDRGVDPWPRNEGQVALADWLLFGETVAVGRFGNVPEGMAIMLLTGEATPSDALATHIATLSAGKVVPEAFARDLPRPAPSPEAVETSAAGAGEAADPSPPWHRPPLPDVLTVGLVEGGCLIAGGNWRITLSDVEAARLRNDLGRLYRRPLRDAVPA